MKSWSENWLLLDIVEHVFVVHPEGEKAARKIARTKFPGRFCNLLRDCGVSLAQASSIIAEVIEREGSANIVKAKEGWSKVCNERLEEEQLDTIRRLIE